jgi:hypothetical protein
VVAVAMRSKCRPIYPVKGFGFYLCPSCGCILEQLDFDKRICVNDGCSLSYVKTHKWFGFSFRKFLRPKDLSDEVV